MTAIKTDQQQYKKITLIECEIQNDWLFYHNNLVILNSEFLQFKILEFAHNVTVAEYSDCMKTYEIV